MSTKYDREYEALVGKNQRTKSVVEQRKAKIQSLEEIIKQYSLAVENHKEFVESREAKIITEEAILESMRVMLPRINDEYLREIDSETVMVYDPEPKTEEELKMHVKDTVGVPRKRFVMDKFLINDWESAKLRFNKINLGHKTATGSGSVV